MNLVWFLIYSFTSFNTCFLEINYFYVLNTKSWHMGVLKFLNWENIILVQPFLNILETLSWTFSKLSGKWARKQLPLVWIGSISINPMVQTWYSQIFVFTFKKGVQKEMYTFYCKRQQPWSLETLFTSLKVGVKSKREGSKCLNACPTLSMNFCLEILNAHFNSSCKNGHWIAIIRLNRVIFCLQSCFYY